MQSHFIVYISYINIFYDLFSFYIILCASIIFVILFQRLHSLQTIFHRTIGDNLSPCYGLRYFPLNQVAQCPLQPGLKHFQRQGIHHFFEQPVPEPHHFYSDFFFFFYLYLIYTYALFSLKPLLLDPFLHSCDKESLPILLVELPVKYWMGAIRSPGHLLFSGPNNPNSFSLSS